MSVTTTTTTDRPLARHQDVASSLVGEEMDRVEAALAARLDSPIGKIPEV